MRMWRTSCRLLTLFSFMQAFDWRHEVEKAQYGGEGVAKYINLAGGVASINPKCVDELSGNVINVDAILGGKHLLIDVPLPLPPKILISGDS